MKKFILTITTLKGGIVSTEVFDLDVELKDEVFFNDVSSFLKTLSEALYIEENCEYQTLLDYMQEKGYIGNVYFLDIPINEFCTESLKEQVNSINFKRLN